MGQCWSQPRSRRRPLRRSVKVAPIAQVKCEMVKNDPISLRDYGEF